MTTWKGNGGGWQQGHCRGDVATGDGHTVVCGGRQKVVTVEMLERVRIVMTWRWKVVIVVVESG